MIIRTPKKLTSVAFLLAATCATVAHAEVKVGFVGTLSGPAAALGQDQYDGFMLGLEHVGGKLGGKDTKIIKEDDQQKPDVGVQVLRKLVEKDKVDLVTGVTFSNVMMAMAKPLTDTETMFVGSNAGPAPLAGKLCNANFFFTSWQNDNQAEVLGQYATDKGYKKLYLMAPNYQSGKDQVQGFKRFYKGNIAGEVFTQLNQPDYSAEIAQMQAAAPDAVFAFFPGGMGVNFIKQMRQASMLGKQPLLTVSTVDGTTLPALKETALGVYSGSFWGPDFDNATSRKFVADFEKKYNRIPSQYAAQAYDSALLIDSALRKTGGNTSDKAALRAALKAADFNSARGKLQFGANGFPIQDMSMFEVAKNAAGQVSLKTIATPLKNLRDAYAAECALK